MDEDGAPRGVFIRVQYPTLLEQRGCADFGGLLIPCLYVSEISWVCLE